MLDIIHSLDDYDFLFPHHRSVYVYVSVRACHAGAFLLCISAFDCCNVSRYCRIASHSWVERIWQPSAPKQKVA